MKPILIAATLFGLAANSATYAQENTPVTESAAVTADAYIDRQLEVMGEMTEAMKSGGPKAATEVVKAKAPALRVMWNQLQADGVDVGAASNARIDEINTVRMGFTDALTAASFADMEATQKFLAEFEKYEVPAFGF